MKTKREIISNMYTNAANLKHIAEFGTINGSLLTEIERVMEEYASEYKAAYDKILEEKATDVSFHYADLENETTEKLKDQISEMIYNAIPTGEVDAFTLIKVLKKLKSDVEAI